MTRRLPVAKNCVLFLRITRGAVAVAIREVEDRWGWEFRYRTCYVWGEDELLLAFTRGLPVQPPKDLALDIFDATVKRLWPDARKLEMAAHTTRDGWDSLGGAA